MNSGKLLDCSAGGVKTFSVHIKEVSLFNFTEGDQLTTSASNYAECLVYQSLVNVSSGLTRFATNLHGVITCRQSIIDDQSPSYVFLTNGTGNAFDTYDFGDCLVMQTNGSSRRFVPLPSSYGGNGVSGVSSPTRSAINTGTLNLSGSSHVDVFLITGNQTLVAATTYAFSAGLYPGQSKTVIFTGTHTCNGFALNLCGVLHGARTPSVGPCRVDLYWDGSTWHAFLTGRSRFSGQETGTQTNVADTSGAALAALETSVNAVKAVLRSAGVMN
jgi:hypothetical protein